MKHIFKLIIAIAVMTGGFAFVAPAANADTQPTTTVTNTSSSTAADQAKVTSAAHIDTNVSANTVFYVKSGGMSKSDQPVKPRSIRLSKGASIWTSYINVYGKEVWHWKYYPAGYVFKLGKDGWYHDPKCYNKVAIKGKKKPKHAIVIAGKIVIKKSRSYVVTAAAKVTLTVKATATASCGDANNGSSATATGYGYVYTYARSTVRGTDKVAITNKAKSNANNLTQSVKFTSKDVADATSTAGGNASASASVKVTCTSTPQPPVVSPPTISAAAQSCVAVGGTNGVITGAVTNNDSASHDAVVTAGGKSTTITVPAGKSTPFSLSGFAPGTYTVTATMSDIGKSVTTQVTVNECAVQSSSIVSLEQPNDVLWGNSRTIKVTGVVPSGQTATLKSSANIGTIASGDRSIVVSGDFTVYLHYTAPTEGTSDTVTVDLYSQTGHKDDTKSVSFGLTQPPVDPK